MVIGNSSSYGYIKKCFSPLLLDATFSTETQLEANNKKIKVMEERLDMYVKIIMKLSCQNAELLKIISEKMKAEGKLEKGTVIEATTTKKFRTSRANLDELI